MPQRTYQSILNPYIGKSAHMTYMPQAVIELDFTGNRHQDHQLLAVEDQFVIVRNSQRVTLLIPFSVLVFRFPPSS
jgi:hypothetical protein